MDPITQQAVFAAAGAGGGAKTYVDDVFSTFLYEGNNSTHNITNGIDLAGEGGLSWIKVRDTSDLHILVDTERGATKQLSSNSTASEVTQSRFSSFNSDGFTVATNDNEINNSAYDYVSWTFRKAPGFFDVVTYSGSSNNQTISHSLGSVPGMIIVKNLTDTESWAVYHRDIGRLNSLYLNETSAQSGTVTDWQYLNPTASSFFVGTNSKTGANGKNYVAYIFAHDDASFGTDEDESIIKCGSYTGNSGGEGPEINLGWEPQWVMIKKTNGTGGDTDNWIIYDSMRGIVTGSTETNGNDKALCANLSTQEDTGKNYAADLINLTSTGFKLNNQGYSTTDSGNHIYMAIRRPHKPPEAGTEVLQSLTYTGSGGNITRSTNILVDFVIAQRTAGGDPYISDRLRGPKQGLIPSASSAESSPSNFFSEFGNNYIKMGNSAAVNDGGTAYLLSMFKRAPGFMDVVAYQGTGSAHTVNHNLDVTPELAIFKKRNAGYGWLITSSELSNWSNKFIMNNGQATLAENIFTAVPTPTQLKLSTSSYVNASGDTYIAYLFATLSDISKVGTYSGYTSNAVNVNCGFSAGARFILIKRIDADADWYVWDTTRGIVSGNDPYILLNSDAAQVTNTDYIDPLSTGFTVTASAPAALNATGGTYLFLAIA
tara:strand:- start:49 stop:2019 length:1971 start_codon:yes stop_codon:yes gene_type:complete